MPFITRSGERYRGRAAIRLLMRYGAALPAEFDLSHLRHVASVGEALDPEAVVWGREAWGRRVHDNWWQTETGAICGATCHVA